jgi:short-subunit dehydrogenase
VSAVVTGAAGGIGRAVVDALAERGHRIIAQDVAPIDFVDNPIIGDLRDPLLLTRIESAARSAGDVAAVVAAHGIAGAGRLDEVDEAAACRVMSVNFESVVQLWDRVRPALEDTHGAFVVIVSQAGLVGEAGNAIYCASKFALTGWLRGLAAQTSVRVRAVYPGGIRTPLLDLALHEMAAARDSTYEAFTEYRYAATPAGRIAEPDELRSTIGLALDLEAAGLVELPITGGEVLW